METLGLLLLISNLWIDMGEVEDSLLLNDLVLADSFINFDYVPPSVSEPIVIEEAIQKISLIEIEGNENDKDDIRVEMLSDNQSDSAASALPSTSFTMSSDNNEKEELEEGEIIDSDAFDNNDEDDDNCVAGRTHRSRNELEILPFVPAVNVTLKPHHQMLPLGVVISVLGAQVIVEGVEKHDPLNEGSILWITESRTPLGLIDEIFGPVKNPYYTVRYNSENEVPQGFHRGTLISFVAEFVNHVINNKDLYKKGYDTSGLYDEEVSDDTEFSDDEKEAEYKRMTKKSINGKNHHPGKRENNRKKVSSKDVVPTIPVAPAASLHCSGIEQGLCGATNAVPPRDGLVPKFPAACTISLSGHRHYSPFSDIGQGHCGPTNVALSFPILSTVPHLTTSGVWTDGTTLQQQQSALFSNGFPVNGAQSQENTQFCHQLPVTGIPFQQQLYPSHQIPPAIMFPRIQPNAFAQFIRPVDQNQTTFGLSSLFPQNQPPGNLQGNSIPSNQLAPHQFVPGAPAINGRKFFHKGCRKDL